MEKTNDNYLLPIGTTLQNGKYRVDAHLASGGFGNTYRITNVTFSEVYALKEFYLRGVNERDGATQWVSVSNADNTQEFQLQKDKFHKEALRLRKLDNPHVVHVYDLFEENGTSYYVMDFLQGESLSSCMKSAGHAFSEQEVLDYTEQILDALDTIHRENIWHLDLKPGNIMTDGKGRAVLIDFGASKQLYDSEGRSLSTSTGLCYTPGFAPTEQIEGSMSRMGPWTDIFALGATMFNLLTMKTPPSVSEIQDGEAFDFPVATSAKMRQLIQWMMEPNRNKRPQSVTAVRLFLNNGGTIPSTPQESTETKNTKPVSEPTRVATHVSESTKIATPRIVQQTNKKTVWPWIIGGVAGVTILLLLSVIVGLMLSSNSRDPYENRPIADEQQVEDRSRQNQGSAHVENIPEEAPPATPPALRLSMTGTVGGADDAVLLFDQTSGKGTLTFTAYGAYNKRVITLDSYDWNSGRLVLNEFYADGRYIGKLKGTLSSGGHYSGVFTNEQTGGSVNFSLRDNS